MQWMIIGLVLAVGCSSKRAASPEDCKAFGAKVAATIAPSAGKKNPLEKYVERELIADLGARLEPLCRDKLPAAHVACVLESKSATEADRCPFDVDVETAQAFREGMNQAVLAAIEYMMSFPATKRECADAGAAMAKELGSVAPLPPHVPDASELAALCESDRWDAAFVRCYNAQHDTKECRSQPKVQDGIRRLLHAR